ncbi:MAG: DUF4331 family protein [Actinomycetota bacterium]|nr:DUF4331 family protein [Actinomycetota bacterium]
MSDHGDAPLAREYPASDIADIFVFEGCPDVLTMIMTVNPVTYPEVTAGITLDPETVYEFKIDTTGDFTPDLAFKVACVGTGPRQQITLLRATGEAARRSDRTGDVIATGWASDGSDVDIVHGSSGEKLYVGPRQDPFFFDFIDLKGPVADLLRGNLGHDFPAKPVGTSEYTFRCTNVTAIAIELPIDHTKFGIWGLTTRQGHRIDRNGRPSIAAIFLPHDDEADDAFNFADPIDDRERFGDAFRRALRNYGADLDLVDSYLPDILPVDLTQDTIYPNGRGIVEDPVTAQIFAVNPDTTGNKGITKNPIGFSAGFPYLTPPVGDGPGWTDYPCPKPLPKPE